LANHNNDLIEKKLIEQINRHLDGLKSKIVNDFSKNSFEEEIEKLKSDIVYSCFSLSNDKYALIRLMGRVSVSIGRRLGEIYDKIPRLIAQIVFDIPEEEIAPKIGNRLELDICLPFDSISKANKTFISKTLKNYKIKEKINGVGIEIRYNFNPNDSARLRKDVDMVNLLLENKLSPIYIIFSSISPRVDAISRLERAGWQFLIGEQAFNFSNSLFGIDIIDILNKEKIKKEINENINAIMDSLYQSYAFQTIKNNY